MKNLALAAIALLSLLSIASCDDTETYAEQKDKERAAINKFINDSSITVISEAQFKEQDSTTDVSKNEFVLFNNSGVYMQIVRKGCGKYMKNGETATVLCRFTETNLLTDSLQLTNDILSFSSIVDKMTVSMSGGTFTASFISGESVMASAYSSTSVPSGWLVPLKYVKLGRPTNADEEIAKVNIIVPHTQGHQYASSGVYPCYYTLTYERGR